MDDITEVNDLVNKLENANDGLKDINGSGKVDTKPKDDSDKKNPNY